MNFFKDYLWIKRAFDVFLALMGIMLLFPFWFLFGFLIRMEDAGPIFYLQERVGKDGKIFKSIKFRSMIPDAEKNLGPVQARKNDPRITNIGRLLRKTAMDESPQLINIFNGDMSFVGPRALRPMEKEMAGTSGIRDIYQIPGFPKRSGITPGLTGVAQVFASRSLVREEKLKYDLWYLDNMSLGLDIKLMVKSIFITLSARWDT